MMPHLKTVRSTSSSRLHRIAAAVTLAIVAGLSAPCARAADLLAEYDFESIPAFLPDWGAGHGGTYKPAAGWKTPFTVALDEGNPHSGNKDVIVSFLEASTGDKIFHSPAIAIPENSAGRLRIRFYYRATDLPEGTLRFRVLELNDQSKPARFLDNKDSLIPLPATAEWVEAQCDGPISPDTRSVQLMWVTTGESASSSFQIDDVAVEILADGE